MVQAMRMTPHEQQVLQHEQQAQGTWGGIEWSVKKTGQNDFPSSNNFLQSAKMFDRAVEFSGLSCLSARSQRAWSVTLEIHKLYLTPTAPTRKRRYRTRNPDVHEFM